MNTRSQQRRREILTRLQSSAPPESGPRDAGLGDSDRIVIASFYNPYVCQRFRRALTAAGVGSVTKRHGIKTSVAVEYGDRKVAWQIVALQRSTYPDRRPIGTRRAFDFAILGGAIGGAVGLVAIVASPSHLALFALCGGTVVGGSFLGYVIDRLIRRYRYLGHFQFDTVTCLLLTAAIAIVLSLWSFFVRLTA